MRVRKRVPRPESAGKVRGPVAERAHGGHRAEPFGPKSGSGPWSVSVTSVFMAFAPMGPEASFFDVLDQHRASLLAALRRGGGEPAGRGTCPASRYRAPATPAHAPGRWHAGRPPAAPQVPRPRAGQP